MGKTVLLVDDDDDIREPFALLLEEEGYAVEVAPNGKAAWEALEGGLRPDVILLDMMMPVMTGKELIERLRASPHWGTPVIVITAGRDALPTDAPLSLLHKPIALNELLAVIERMSAHLAARPPAA